jgi:hypothetical protein
MAEKMSGLNPACPSKPREGVKYKRYIINRIVNLKRGVAEISGRLVLIQFGNE